MIAFPVSVEMSRNPRDLLTAVFSKIGLVIAKATYS
jgi:hypothetical protein